MYTVHNLINNKMRLNLWKENNIKNDAYLTHIFRSFLSFIKKASPLFALYQAEFGIIT